VPKERLRKLMEANMKVLYLSIALGLALALWGAAPQSGTEQWIAAGRIAGEQVYSMLR